MHSKYRFSPTDPSFLPMGVSNSTPAHSPAANSVVPIKRKVPVLVPVWLETITRSPSLQFPPPEVEAKDKVEPAGEGVLDLFSFSVELDGDMEARAREAIVDLEDNAEGVSKGVGVGRPGFLVNRDVLEKIPCIGVHCKKEYFRICLSYF